MAKAKKGGVDWSNVRDLALFVFAIALIAGAYGYAAALHNWFPARQVEQAGVVIDKIKEELGWKLPWYYKKVGNLPAIKTYQAGKVAPGLVLVTGLGSENHPEARVIDSQGIANGLPLITDQAGIQFIVTGLVLLVAASVDALSRRRAVAS